MLLIMQMERLSASVIQITSSRKRNKAIERVSRKFASLNFFSWTVTGPFLIQINYRYYFTFCIALGKYNSYPLIIAGCSFQSIFRTRLCFYIALIIIDLSILHDLFHFCLAYFAALHPASSVGRVFYIRYPPVETPVSVNIRGWIGGWFVCGRRWCIIFQRLISTGQEKGQQSQDQ